MKTLFLESEGHGILYIIIYIYYVYIYIMFLCFPDVKAVDILCISSMGHVLSLCSAWRNAGGEAKSGVGVIPQSSPFL